MTPGPRIEILGPVRVWRGNLEVDPGSAQQRTLLSLLAARCGHPVVAAEICSVLWGDNPPKTATNIVHRHVSAIRRLLEPNLPSRAEGQWIHRAAGGYQLRKEAIDLDVLQFREFWDQARRAGQEHDYESALTLLMEGLNLWHGQAAQGIVPDARSHPAFEVLDREQAAAATDAAEWALRTGKPKLALEAVQAAIVVNIHHEPLHASLIRLLAASGNSAQALAVYQTTRLRLREELGIDPGTELREAYLEVLRSDVPVHDLSSTSSNQAAPDRAPMFSVTPAQLPRDQATFAGRHNELRHALEPFETPGSHVSAARVMTLSGMAGIGKTTLAIHLAHQLAEHFPDGQLHVDLRGFSAGESALPAEDALRFFLESLGVPGQHVPHGTNERAALYRSVLAQRRVMVVLDNALDADQVLPLLPVSAGCMAIVASRRPLPALAALTGAEMIRLDVLSDEEAHELLVRRLGAHRVDSEPEAAQEIIMLCDRLPLALAVMAARASAHPDWPLAAIADQLQESKGTLDAFSDPEPTLDARTVFSWSYRALSDGAAELFRLLAVHPGPDVTTAAAAALIQREIPDTRDLLSELVCARLVTERLPGRYTLHDLLRAYASELSQEHDAGSKRRDAFHFLLDHYTVTACSADRLLLPARDPVSVNDACSRHARGPALRDVAHAGRWFAAERTVLLSLLKRAAQQNFDQHACQLAWAMAYLQTIDQVHDYAKAYAIGLAAAQRMEDPRLQAYFHRGLGNAYAQLHRFIESKDHFDQAHRLFEQLDDPLELARTLYNASYLSEETGDLDATLHQVRRAVALYRTSDNQTALALFLSRLSAAHRGRMELTEALASSLQALESVDLLTDPQDRGRVWRDLGLAHHRHGHTEEAVSSFQQALMFFQQAGHRLQEALTLEDLGTAYLQSGNRDTARTTFQKALTLLETLRHPKAAEVRDRLQRDAAR
ncbi:AfsR/SARP family transcriptional regulator (plasmid) [Streptomyces sp. AHU1]|uniref:AfsR/SARP family transcriptional regulator n=1 Tax=Streptomyces sp. AHU1 TaxID=3377215 RepID=UPI00387823EE